MTAPTSQDLSGSPSTSQQAQSQSSAPATKSRPSSLIFPSAGGVPAKHHLNPAVRRAAEGGRHHQRSHSIDTKDRTSPVLGFGPLQGDIAKFLADAPSSAPANGPFEAAKSAATPGPASELGGSREGAAASSSSAGSAQAQSNATANGNQPLQKRRSLSSLPGIGAAGGMARPIPRKASNGSVSSSSSNEGSPDQSTPLETRRSNPRMGDKGLGGGSGSSGSGLGIKDATRRTASPARGPYAGKPISPRLVPYASGAGHARRISAELAGPQRPPSPIFLPSTSPPSLPSNPDPQHSWDSVWPRSPTSDGRGAQHQNKRLGSPASNASSSSPSESRGAGRFGSQSSPASQASDSSPSFSRSPRTQADLLTNALSTSPTIGKPKARRPHELRGSSSSPTLRVSGFAGTKDEVGSPLGLRAAPPTRQRGMETSKSEPIRRIGFHPIANDNGSAGSPGAGPASSAAGRLHEERDFEGDPSKKVASERSPLERPTLPTLSLPAVPATSLKLSPASPRSPFLQLSSPPAHTASHQDMQLSESPPKTRSFIAMPPRSGYELSDDPDDVGSEDGSSSGRGSVGTNDEDDDFNDDGDGEGRAGRSSFEDDENDEDDSMADRIGRSIAEASRARSEEPDGPANGDTSVGSGAPLRPNLPKRPSLTRSGAVPAPPAVLDPLAGAEASARALAAQKGSQGASLLTYFKDQYEQTDASAPAGPPMADALMLEDGSQMNDAVQPSALGLDAGEAMDESMMDDGSGGEQVEESLNTLERIFLFAKSDMAYHRVLVASSLPDWIREVELSDAVEYIIPLLNGLGTDELDVCAAFAPELSRLMWFFFRNCPLAELDDSDARDRSASGAPQSTPAEAGSTGNDETTDEMAMRPRISVSTFTSLLCALLLNQNNLIAGATQQSLVQFFCRLENHDLDMTREELAKKSDEEVQARKMALHMDGFIGHASGRDGQPVPHEAYDFDERARQAVREELIENVAFAIARLSQEQGRESSHPAMDDEPFDLAAAQDRPEHAAEGDQELGRESGSQDVADEPEGAAAQEHGEDRQSETSGSADATEDISEGQPPSQESIGSGSDDGTAGGEANSQDAADTEMMDESQLLESWAGGSSPFAYGSTPDMSEHKADMAEEAAVGRMASVSLLAALCNEELIARDVLLERMLPEILGMSDDGAFFVRKEVAGALGPMAKNLEHDLVTERLLPAFDKAMNDRIWHVRLAACFSLPAVLGRLQVQARREKSVSSLRTFVNDVSRKVRIAALEIIGETIFMFKDDERGVPDELMRFFIGEPFDGPPQQGDASLSFGDRSFGVNASRDASQMSFGDVGSPPGRNYQQDDDGDSLLASFGFSKGGDTSLGEPRWETEFGTTDADPERPLVMAFNFPAVVLTLGADRWSQLRTTYAELTEHMVPNVRKSLAASLHELAKIIGPSAARDDLLPAADKFMVDLEHEVRIAALENIDVFLGCLPRTDAEGCLRRMLVLWSMDFARDWRLREKLASHIPSMARHFLLDDEEGNLVSLMQLALADSVSAVRDAGVRCVPDLYRTFADDDQVIADGFLGMVSDLGDSDGYRLRVACLLCIQTLVDKQALQRSSCELLLVNRLIQMGNDPVVDVRIALAKTVGRMCRLDELYALPQSRSAELNGLLARLGRDQSLEVREAVDGILSPEEAAQLAEAAGSPVYPPRNLVLGPADGGPHKPEGSLSMHQGSMLMGDNVLPLFDMDEGHDIEDVDMDDEGDEGAQSLHADRASDGAAHHLSSSDDEAHGPTQRDGDSSFEEDEEPHHLLGVDLGAEHGGDEGEAQASDAGGVLSLSSPQRPQETADSAASQSGAVADASNGSPSTKAKGADPFLAFVAGRRSQDLSNLKLNFNFDHGLENVANGPHRGGGTSLPSWAAVASGESAAAAHEAPTEAALRQLEEAGESLRSPGSSEDGSVGKRSAPSSGDWSLLRGDPPAAAAAVSATPLTASEGGVSSSETPAGPATENADSADDDFVTVDAEETKPSSSSLSS